MTEAMTKAKRIEIVNEIIKEISTRGRRFFYNAKNDKTGKVILKNGRLYFETDWHAGHHKPLVNLAPKDDYPPVNFHHGGTLWALLRDFRDFIMTGEKSNHNHGYGGLMCPHWGYPESDMKAIQKRAKDLGYL